MWSGRSAERKRTASWCNSPSSALDEDLLGLPLASAALLEELGDIPHVTYHAGNVRKRGRG